MGMLVGEQVGFGHSEPHHPYWDDHYYDGILEDPDDRYNLNLLNEEKLNKMNRTASSTSTYPKISPSSVVSASFGSKQGKIDEKSDNEDANKNPTGIYAIASDPTDYTIKTVKSFSRLVIPATSGDEAGKIIAGICPKVMATA